MALVLTDMQKVKVSVAPVDAAGNPGKIDGPPIFSVSDPNLAEVQPDDATPPDSNAAWIVTRGPLGTFQVSVQADADLGEGVQPITGTLDIEVQPSAAVSMAVVAGAPVSRV